MRAVGGLLADEGESDTCGETVELMRGEVRARRGLWGQGQRPVLWEAKGWALCGDCLFRSRPLYMQVSCLIFQMKNLYHKVTPLKAAGHKIGAPASGALAVKGEWAVSQGLPASLTAAPNPASAVHLSRLVAPLGLCAAVLIHWGHKRTRTLTRDREAWPPLPVPCQVGRWQSRDHVPSVPGRTATSNRGEPQGWLQLGGAWT